MKYFHQFKTYQIVYKFLRFLTTFYKSLFKIVKLLNVSVKKKTLCLHKTAFVM